MLRRGPVLPLSSCGLAVTLLRVCVPARSAVGTWVGGGCVGQSEKGERVRYRSSTWYSIRTSTYTEYSVHQDKEMFGHLRCVDGIGGPCMEYRVRSTEYKYMNLMMMSEE